MNQKAKWSAQLFIVFLCALGLKYFYSTASPNELRWILGPTTWLVELLSGRKFYFESFSGYMSGDHSFLIAASCAGVNFLITAFLMLSLRKLWKERFQSSHWNLIPLSMCLAFVVTIIANTFRICIALELQRFPQGIGFLNRNQLHQFEGIIVYFSFLLLLYLMSDRTDSKLKTSGLGRLIFPLVFYYVVTLVMPLANGGYQRGTEFWQHSLFVFVTPVGVMLLIAFGRLGWGQIRKGGLLSPAGHKPE
jgi:exosortase K